jgi:hypothetical protein
MSIKTTTHMQLLLPPSPRFSPMHGDGQDQTKSINRETQPMRTMEMFEVQQVSGGELTPGEAAAAIICIAALPATGIVALAALSVAAIAWMP